MDKLDELKRQLGDLADVGSAIALLHWDLETYMPPKAAPGRGQQLATLSAIGHRMLTAPELGDLLRELASDSDALAPDARALVVETLYDHDRAVKLPESYVRRFAEEQSKAYDTWVRARETADFATFQPNLAILVDLLRERAELLGYEGSPYNALLEDHERGMTAEQLQPMFAELSERQTALVQRIAGKETPPDTAWLNGAWDEDAQWAATLDVIERLGFDLEAGRQDRSVHPFTTNFDVFDVRLTTRTNPEEPFSALTGSIHECGHGLYEQGFIETDRRTPLAQAPSLGIHESQSRMWENMIGRSLPFWRHCTPLLRKHFPGRLDDVSPEQIHRAMNRVRPSLIRVEADECTYNLHIVLRFEIELALIEGDITVADVPELWNAKMKQSLGIDVPDDAQGCLQDIHWSHGSMGYFPTYTLGNLYAAQLFEQILADVPALWDDVEHGRFESLLAWLREHVHRLGRRKLARQIVADATGKEPSSQPFLDYLETKYTALYEL